MTSISPINFCGAGTESTGSVAYRNNHPETPADENKVNFRGGGTETTGSIANNSLQQPETDVVQFRGGGTETTGSIAHTDKPVECPNCGTQVNFKGRYDDDKRGISAFGVGACILGLTVATIVGLGYAHKTGQFSKLGDGWFGKTLKKIEPAGEKCHKWCATVKKTSVEWWNKLKGNCSAES